MAAPQASARALSAAFSELKTFSVPDNGRYSDSGRYSDGATTHRSPLRSRPGYSPPKYGQAPESIHSQGHDNSGGGLGSFKNSFKGTVSTGASVGSSVSGNERLYEAYNELHSLAQVFKKPFDAPAILIVGHQTDGKSALVEALMGFQFNHVGGGTKTRRPITLQMSYNPHRHEPRCFLVLDKDVGREEPKTLPQLQVSRRRGRHCLVLSFLSECEAVEQEHCCVTDRSSGAG